MRPELERLGELCLDLPEAERELSGAHAIFRVRRRTFAYFQDDHHGDGMLTVVAKASPGRGDELVAAEPERYVRAAYIGPRGWVALRLDMPDVDWDDVEALVVESYLLVAPKRLAAAVREA